MSWLSNPKKALKRHFSFDSWKKGRGVIGFYNPIFKIRRDALKLARGVYRGTASGNVAKLFGIHRHSPLSFYNGATAPTSARSIADIS